MSFEQYPEYRDCDRGWVSRLPKNWKLTQLRHIAHIYAGGTPDRNNPDFWTNGTVPWLNSGSVNDWCITSPSEWITDLAASGGHTRWVPPKSVVVALAGQGKTKGMAARLEFRSTCNQSMAAIVPNNLLEYRFLQFWITANYENVRNLAGGDLRDGLNLQHIGGIYIPLPSVGEQEAIANFLDHETAEIDAFIDDQQRLIELLEERRAATITHVVTKGLDPNVPMKETGLEWAPLIPRDWKINKISRAFRASKGQNAAALTHEYCASIPGQYPVYSGQTGNEGVMALINTYEFDAGDSGVLLTTTVGAKAMSVLYIQNRFSLSQNCMVISPVTNLVTRYYYYQFQALFEYEKGKISQHMQASFRMNDLYQYKFLQPPSHEEQQIADYLDREMAELDAAVSDAREAIALSKERRAALISAAVTGQIDVTQMSSRVSAGEVLEQEVRV